MTQTNLILKAQHYENISPLITIEMEMKDYSEAEDIASKLNDISKARKETSEYWVVSTEIPSLIKKIDDDDIPF
jgi:hypothetical protein|tara:strand:- start:468 stop:689 length:222 start_codon:yes stop_codon:yes gene_type:complete